MNLFVIISVLAAVCVSVVSNITFKFEANSTGCMKMCEHVCLFFSKALSRHPYKSKYGKSPVQAAVILILSRFSKCP